MFKISKECSLDMAHLLDGPDGQCQNLHGHPYKFKVPVTYIKKVKKKQWSLIFQI